MTAHTIGDTAVLTGRSLRHILRSPDTIITTAVIRKLSCTSGSITSAITSIFFFSPAR